MPTVPVLQSAVLTSVVSGVSLLAGVGTATAGYLAVGRWGLDGQNRTDELVRPFVLFCALATASSVLLAALLPTLVGTNVYGDVDAMSILDEAGFVVIYATAVLVPLPWVVFALRYTGRNALLRDPVWSAQSGLSVSSWGRTPPRC